MKKLFLFLVVAATFFTASAQTSSSFTKVSTAGVTKTTLTNTDTLYANGIIYNGFYRAYAATALVTKTSGTVVGTIALQGTLNGTDWYTITSTALADATTVYGFTQNPAFFNQYRLRAITSGTQVVVVTHTNYYYKGRQ